MNQETSLKRVITLPLLVFYGVGTILGAGIYALTGKIAGVSGFYAPIAFLFSALIAAFVAFSYAELSSRYPKSAGEAVYVEQAFKQPWLSCLVGWGIIATGIVSSAVMARAFYAYLQIFISLPDSLAVLLFVVLISTLAASGISFSVRFAALVTVIEISGVLLVLYVSRNHLYSFSERWQELIPPLSWEIWQAIISGAFLAFYAFIGFEDMVNVAEEVIEPEKNLPIAIIIALIVTTVFYVLVSLAAVLSLPLEKLANHSAPFALIIKENSQIPVELITLISLIAILNGALVQMIMGARVMYGMAQKNLAPSFLATIHPKTQTPVFATLCCALLVLVIAWWLPITSLAKLTSLIILLIFALVNLSLAIIKFKQPEKRVEGIDIPLFVPIIGFLLCLGFIFLQH